MTTYRKNSLYETRRDRASDKLDKLLASQIDLAEVLRFVIMDLMNSDMANDTLDDIADEFDADLSLENE